MRIPSRKKMGRIPDSAPVMRDGADPRSTGRKISISRALVYLVK